MFQGNAAAGHKRDKDEKFARILRELREDTVH
jgi:hypothetical protein